ncbi:thioredoxin family protein [Calothrix sp. 336/3]|uniref:thioredoxin family protein n=1 Tax=Calothrix sp. 336/3 TaxID=1337936 RepID=UPI0004E45E66|nr:thioredoxin family protein [Calothrix sp. 336/3]AKG22400.1 alkyl hydroperoxide reductase [Calothrix sp. 336/3]
MNTLETINTPIGGYAPDFELPGTDHQVHHLSRYLEKFRAVGVISLCNHCPFVKSYIYRLKEIQNRFSASGVTLIGLNGDENNQLPGENFEQMQLFAQEWELNFPYIWDPTQDVVRSFGAIATPMAFLIDQTGVVRYRGQIDDSPYYPQLAKKHYLQQAIACLLQQKTIPVSETPPLGTTLVWRN